MMGFKFAFLLVLVGLVGRTTAMFEGFEPESVELVEQFLRDMDDSGHLQSMIAPVHGRKLVGLASPDLGLKHLLTMVDRAMDLTPQEWLEMFNSNYDWIATMLKVQGIKKGPEVPQPEVVANVTMNLEMLFTTIISKEKELQMMVDGYTLKTFATLSNDVLRNTLDVLTTGNVDLTSRHILMKLFSGNSVSAEEFATLKSYGKIYRHVAGDIDDATVEQILTQQGDAQIIKEYELSPNSGIYGTHRPQANPALYEFMVEGRGEMTMPLWASLTQRFKIPDDLFVPGFTDADREAKRAYMRQFIRRQIDPDVQQRFYECQHFDESVIMSLVSKGALSPSMGNIAQLGSINAEQMENTLTEMSSVEYDTVDITGVAVAGQFISIHNVKNAVGKYRRVVSAARILTMARASGQVKAIDEVYAPLVGVSLDTVLEAALTDFSEMDDKLHGAACVFLMLSNTNEPSVHAPKISWGLSRIMAVWKPVQLVSPDAMSNVYANTYKNFYSNNLRALMYLSNGKGFNRLTTSRDISDHFGRLIMEESFMRTVVPNCLLGLINEVVEVVISLTTVQTSTTGEILGFTRGILEKFAEPNSPLYDKLIKVYSIRQEVTKKLRGSV